MLNEKCYNKYYSFEKYLFWNIQLVYINCTILNYRVNLKINLE